MIILTVFESILAAFLFSLILQLVLFAAAYLFQTDKLTDVSYGLTFFFLALFAWFLAPFQSWGLLLAVGMVVAWSIRLTTYLGIRISVIKKDHRFDEMRSRFWSFLGFWVLQAVSVWVIMLPVIVFAHQPRVLEFPLVALLGLAIWFVGLSLETTADWQKFVFKLDPKNNDTWIESGVWRYARHPNYFGEMLCWWGVFAYVVPFFASPWYLATIVSPVFITILLLFVSGVPLLEKRYNQKYATNEKYQAYKKRTTLLLPLPLK